jgi:fructokinase
VVKLSEEELAFISGSDDIVEGIAALTQRYQPELLLVTQGKAGVLAAFQQQLPTFRATGGQRRYHRRRRCVCRRAACQPCRQRDAGGYRGPGTGNHAQTCGALATTAKGAMTALPYQHDLTAHFDPKYRLAAHFVASITLIKPV